MRGRNKLDELTAAGCKVLDDSSENVIISCPKDRIEPPSREDIVDEDEDDVTFRMKREREGEE